MKNDFSKFKSGFTLVELVITTAIMLIMTGTLFMNQSRNKAQDDVESAAGQIVAQLRGLQNEALSGKKIGTNTACYFKFNSPVSTSNLTAYSISYGNCEGGGTLGSVQQIQLNSGKKIANVAISSAAVSFVSPWGRVTSNSKITIQSTIDSGKSASVCICTSGNIFEKRDNTCSC